MIHFIYIHLVIGILFWTNQCHGFITNQPKPLFLFGKNTLVSFRPNAAAPTSTSLFMESNTYSSTYSGSNNSDIIKRPLNQPLPNQIPNLDSSASKLAKEFYTMMDEFAQFTPIDIQSVNSPRYRALYEGVLAGANEPKVMNAFCIVFEDYLPIRLAGRMIYKHLKSVMARSIREREEIEQKLVNNIGVELHTIDNGRRLFSLAIMDDLDEADGKLSLQDLIDSGIVEMVIELLEFESFDAFIEQIEKNEDGKITFESFMVGLQKCTSSTGSDDECEVICDLDEVLIEVVARMEPKEKAKRRESAPVREKKHSDQYDSMVKSFEQWEGLIPTSGDGRLIQVLDGCFSGAKNEKIVAALKTVYMDYSALRIGGDLVFKLMRKLVERK